VLVPQSSAADDAAASADDAALLWLPGVEQQLCIVILTANSKRNRQIDEHLRCCSGIFLIILLQIRVQLATAAAVPGTAELPQARKCRMTLTSW
jgi:hypothetical protein